MVNNNTFILFYTKPLYKSFQTTSANVPRKHNNDFLFCRLTFWRTTAASLQLRSRARLCMFWRGRHFNRRNVSEWQKKWRNGKTNVSLLFFFTFLPYSLTQWDKLSYVTHYLRVHALLLRFNIFNRTTECTYNFRFFIVNEEIKCYD